MGILFDVSPELGVSAVYHSASLQLDQAWVAMAYLQAGRLGGGRTRGVISAE